jgi:hypothetical protein
MTSERWFLATDDVDTGIGLYDTILTKKANLGSKGKKKRQIASLLTPISPQGQAGKPAYLFTTDGFVFKTNQGAGGNIGQPFTYGTAMYTVHITYRGRVP